jgi:hypothetical protein
MNLLTRTKKDIKESKTISRYLSKNHKEFKIEILIDEVIYHLISEKNNRTILKVGTYAETSKYLNRTDFDLHKKLHYSDNNLEIIFNNLA